VHQIALSICIYEQLLVYSKLGWRLADAGMCVCQTKPHA